MRRVERVREIRWINACHELKVDSQNNTERTQAETVGISCEVLVRYQGKGLTFRHHTLYALLA